MKTMVFAILGAALVGLGFHVSADSTKTTHAQASKPPALAVAHAPDTLSIEAQNTLVSTTCSTCHDDEAKTGGLTLEHFEAATIALGNDSFRRLRRLCWIWLRFLAEVLGLEFEQGVEAGFVVGVVGELGGEGAAELNGFGEEGVGPEIAGGSVRGLATQLAENVFGLLMNRFDKFELITRECEPRHDLTLPHQRFLIEGIGPRDQFAGIATDPVARLTGGTPAQRLGLGL